MPSSSSAHVILPTAAEKAREKAYVCCKVVQGRGRSVFTRIDIPANTCLMVYPGRVTRAANNTANGKYTWSFFKLDRKTGVIDRGYTISAEGIEGYAAPRVNEPPHQHLGRAAKAKRGNIQVVLNLVRRPEPALEYWTCRDIAAGEELFVCYGRKYKRDYKTACTRGQDVKWKWRVDQASPSSRPYGTALVNALVAADAVPNATYAALANAAHRAVARKRPLNTTTATTSVHTTGVRHRSPNASYSSSTARNATAASALLGMRSATASPSRSVRARENANAARASANARARANAARARANANARAREAQRVQRAQNGWRAVRRSMTGGALHISTAPLVKRLTALGGVLKAFLRIPKANINAEALGVTTQNNPVIRRRVGNAIVEIMPWMSFRVKSLDDKFKIYFSYEDGVRDTPFELEISCRSASVEFDWQNWDGESNTLKPIIRIKILHAASLTMTTADLEAIFAYVRETFRVQMRGLIDSRFLRSIPNDTVAVTLTSSNPSFLTTAFRRPPAGPGTITLQI